MEKSGYRQETNVDYQPLEIKNKLIKLFNYAPDQTLENCPIRDILSVSSDKWSILIIMFVGGYEVLRFGDLKKNIQGISAKVLTERLRSLERDGYLQRELFPEVPVRVEYRLTSFGIKYLHKLVDLAEWIKEDTSYVLESRKRFDKSSTT
ncbi:MAG: helix-turn-helix transcriptional regulator [Cytophagaceae bacterium]|jgi:DNA-binding HxlR family transcriptional regulator|nr:helix-turn-helix transcriptional regulator [Cytophagaceae bacterium]